MTLHRLLLATAALTLLAAPAQAQTKTKQQRDPAIECGALFTIMAEQAEAEADKAIFTEVGNLLFSEAEGRLNNLGVSAEEQGRLGSEAVMRVSEGMASGDWGVTFGECHDALETSIDVVLPGQLSTEARDLLLCASQFLYQIDNGDYTEAEIADFRLASDDQYNRAQADMEASGMATEDMESIATYYGLSVGLALGMGEEPLVPWEQCGEL